MTSYRNPWPTGPAEFKTEAKPHRYKGHLLYNRIPGTVCDIVQNDEAVGQCVTVRGARAWVDLSLDAMRAVSR